MSRDQEKARRQLQNLAANNPRLAAKLDAGEVPGWQPPPGQAPREVQSARPTAAPAPSRPSRAPAANPAVTVVPYAAAPAPPEVPEAEPPKQARPRPRSGLKEAAVEPVEPSREPEFVEPEQHAGSGFWDGFLGRT